MTVTNIENVISTIEFQTILSLNIARPKQNEQTSKQNRNSQNLEKE